MTDQLIYIDGELYHADDFTSEELAHYGVKGMKWGKRKARRDAKSMIREARRNGASRADIQDIKRRRRAAVADMRGQARDIRAARAGGTRGRVDLHNRTARLANKGLDKLNSKYANADLINDKKANARYMNEYSNMYNAAHRTAKQQRKAQANASVKYRGL